MTFFKEVTSRSTIYMFTKRRKITARTRLETGRFTIDSIPRGRHDEMDGACQGMFGLGRLAGSWDFH
jgi:hypothetical protein